jgi:hypothetical protein
MFRIGLLLTCLTLAACTTSRAPITAAGAPEPDTGLLGQWRVTVSADDLNPDLLTISRQPDGKLRVDSISEDAADHLAPERLELITARIEGLLYGSVTSLDEELDPPAWMICRYEHVSPDRIQLYIAPLDLLDEAVSRKLITGRKILGRHFDLFELAATAEELRSFVAAHGARVFSLPGPVLERIRGK